MSKYEELVEDVKNMDQFYNALKAKVHNEFIKELANYLECGPDKISVEFYKPDYKEALDMIMWSFTLMISIDGDNRVDLVSLPGFYLSFSRDTVLDVPLSITYPLAGVGLDATTETLYNAIFKKVKKAIIETSKIKDKGI